MKIATNKDKLKEIEYNNETLKIIDFNKNNFKGIRLINNALPIYSNYHLVKDIYKIRSILPFVGENIFLSKDISYLGEYVDYLTTETFNSFFAPTSKFLNLIVYSSTKVLNLNLKRLYIFNVFRCSSEFIRLFLYKKFNVIKPLLLNNLTDISYLYDSSVNYKHFKLERKKNLNIFQLNIRKRILTLIKTKRFFYKLIIKKIFREKKLSKLIAKEKNITLIKKLHSLVLTISNVFYTCFYIPKKDLNWLVLNNYIYLNGSLCKNINISLFKSDRLQLKVNLYIYLKNRYFISNIIKKQKDFEYYYYRYVNVKKSDITTIVNFNKKHFLNLFHTLFDTPKYFEIDYLTLTVFLIYKPFNILDFNVIKLFYLNFYTNKLLN
jgi:hypothetical protein